MNRIIFTGKGVGALIGACAVIIIKTLFGHMRILKCRDRSCKVYIFLKLTMFAAH